MATKKKATKKKKKKARRKKAAKESVGLAADEVMGESPPAEIGSLAEGVVADGGSVIGSYREPFSGHWQLMVSVPLDKVKPIEFQRDLSDTHVKKLVAVIDRLKRYLDPIVLVRAEDGTYETPNGHHRFDAMRRLGARSIIGVLVPERELAFQILALNTEKAPNLKDRALETIRMARSLMELGDPEEHTFETEFEDPSHLTIGAAYEKRPRFAGSTYHSVLKKCEAFFEFPMSEAVEEREARADRLLEVDDEVARLVKELKGAGFDSPYLKAFVVARLNPLRGPRAEGEFEETIDKMLERAEKFDVDAVNANQISASGGF